MKYSKDCYSVPDITINAGYLQDLSFFPRHSGMTHIARAMFRVSKTAIIKKKGMFFRLIKKHKIRVSFLPTINTGLGYDFEPISLIRV